MFLRVLIFILFSHLSLQTSLASNNDGVTQLAVEDEFLRVEEAYQLDIDISADETTLIWSLAPQYYLYNHGFAHQVINHGETQSLSPNLPLGLEKEDEYFGLVETYYDQVVIRLAHSTFNTAIETEFYLKASSQGCADAGLCYPPYHLYYKISLDTLSADSISAEAFNEQQRTSNLTVNSTMPTTVTEDINLFWVLLSALLGGLILNLMPCVFPVLSIKVLQLTRHHDPATARIDGIAYMLGTVLSFVAVAALMLTLRAGGSAIGWGFQLQNPLFIALLVYLFFFLAISMSGIVHVGQQWMGIGQNLTEAGGAKGAFFTGVLAVVVASPCTAPFMGTALGYAVSQSTSTALLVFAALGVGMALPLTAASFIPVVSHMLPKPGPWMERIKECFAFPLYATCIWLLWVLGNQTNTSHMAIVMLGCLGMYLIVWGLASTSRFSRIVITAVGIIALVSPLSSKPNHNKQQADNHIAYTAEALAEYRRQGIAVFIDLTADWCITCIANEQSTLETEAVQTAFNEAGIVYMVGDWTHHNPEITALLSEYKRSGIPLYLLFPAQANAPATVLPQILSKRIVLDAIRNISEY